MTLPMDLPMVLSTALPMVLPMALSMVLPMALSTDLPIVSSRVHDARNTVCSYLASSLVTDVTIIQ